MIDLSSSPWSKSRARRAATLLSLTFLATCASKGAANPDSGKAPR